MTMDKKSWGIRRNMDIADILTPEELISEVSVILDNYGHDDFSIGLLRDTTLHAEILLMIFGAKHPFLWNHARF